MPKRKRTHSSLLELSRARKFDNYIRIKRFDPETPYNDWPKEWKTVYYKAYPRFDQIILPSPSDEKFDLFSALTLRSSCRDFSSQPIELKQLGNLLYYSVGMKKTLKRTISENRMHPSAGARYPLEIYILVFNVQELEPGVYHYHLKTHSLELIPFEDVQSQAVKQVRQQWIKDAGFLVVPTAVFERTEMKYKDRGYRHIMTEYGHIAQNVYLVGTALNLGVCSVGGFIDDGLNRILDIDGRVESVIGLIAIGNKKQ